MQINKTEKNLSTSISSNLGKLDSIMTSIDEKFQEAAEYIKSMPKEGRYKPSNETKLNFYGWYKQATLGECTAKRPGFFKFTEKAKWDAWHKLGKMTKEEAMESYVKEFKKIKAIFEGNASGNGDGS